VTTIEKSNQVTPTFKIKTKQANNMASASASSGSAFEELFGKTLVRKMGATAGDNTTISTSEALAGKKQVGIYFSAHWCPPCRGFTPKLVEEYKKLQKLGFEVIFASSDKDRDSCKSYFEEMTWLTLDYDDRDLKEKLSTQFKVQGIPTLVILDSNAQLVTTKGRSFIGQKSFPFTPPTVSGSLGATLVKKVDGKVTEVATKDALAGKNVALYFSAHWCPPCRGFTPKLAQTYKNMKKLVSEGKLEDNFEFVFVSSDQDEKAFNEYFGEMPWLALPYSNREGKADLSGIFDVQGIPSLVTIDPNGKVINKSARGAVTADPNGLEFPWTPKPVNDINQDQDGLNEETCVIALLSGATDAEKKARLADINAVGKKFFDEAKSKGKDPEFRFFYSNTDGGIVDQIRKLTKIGDGAKTIILDIPDKGGFYVADKEGDVGALLAAYKSKKLKRKQLS